MTTYYRYTNSESPMSDWGHAMFAEDRYKVEGYGSHCYTLDRSKTIEIDDLKNDIINAYNRCLENENMGDLPVDVADYYMKNVTAEDVFESFCPKNIVDSADGFDHDIVVWLWQFVLRPKNIMAVRTPDGAVCFDEDLIEKEE